MPYILAVDDETDLLGTLSRVLGREGHEVSQASSATEAWQKIVYRRPDLVILDVMMPGTNGITLCKQLRDDNRYADLLILFLTAKNDTDDVIAGLDAGGDDYVVKPFELAELTARVRALLRRGQRGEDKQPILEMGEIRLDSDTYQVHVNGDAMQLTATEHRLLRYLMPLKNSLRQSGITRHKPAILILFVHIYAICGSSSNTAKDGLSTSRRSTESAI